MSGRRTVTPLDPFASDQDPSITASYIERVRGVDSGEEGETPPPPVQQAQEPTATLPGPQTPAGAPSSAEAGERFELPAAIAELFESRSDVTSIRIPEAMMNALRDFAADHKDPMGLVISLGLLQVFEMPADEYAKKMNSVWQMDRDGKRLARQR